MMRFLTTRAVRAFAVVFSLSGIVFALAHLVPGDPVTGMPAARIWPSSAYG